MPLSTTSPETGTHKGKRVWETLRPYSSALHSASASLLTANYFLTAAKPYRLGE